jgi:predicted metalloprotease
MRLEGRRESDNVIDVRGSGGRGLIMGGGGIMTLVVLVLAMVFGVDPRPLLQNMPQGGGVAVDQGQPINPEDDPQAELVVFTKKILADTEDTWSQLFQEQLGRRYEPAPLVLFSGVVDSHCGTASAAVGPFYCPMDQRVYLDLSFFDEMKRRFSAPGDFAMAYVIAHEVGHHVQDLLGISSQVQQLQNRLQARGEEAEANHLSVRIELQADYLAGVWAHHAEQRQPFLEDGDVEEALNAARQIGDDNLQRQAQGRVVPDAFTHGTSEQRARWFRAGFRSGDVEGMQQLLKLPYEQL